MFMWSASASESSGVTGPMRRRIAPRLSSSWVRSRGRSARSWPCSLTARAYPSTSWMVARPAASYAAGFGACADDRRGLRDECAAMRFSPTAPVTWRRRNGPDYVGAVELVRRLRAARRTGPRSGIDVSLSIPVEQIETVRRRGADGLVLELTESQAIYVRGLGDDPAVPASLGPLLSRSPWSSA